ncbi:2-(1,2-epoxy-1,2-dihydrophenyl)acetyl-CoA isomerase [Pseudomonas sp. NFACC15-1]|uniref:enoyl-CoA hydratase-related protein n=1 Tax=Pseudomonas TaxID=286 RepID=UPI0008716A63|nr:MULTISPECIES: enoyl-CoA hydratase-related protein [unclassified Pseudomonas]SCW99093.1 2-(1,2-epoxy-1,2-dihydrophenyl)acetyl-CoA isomerase [Pseudomonas sp. NFACC56-3]SDA50952.1 2-(1,2-epoxy-1,2-dihydrophenyl)acetyl-CoA isomerase [Pseudomonas sp. NFACC15-1]SDW82961.1 2-(1,2-epoxy-1,2-dihydrophenyl)acetyl-CoA isomerase [Pseudomonas sp. NFACC14]SFK87854.1 2-(1,2-epoxy-1,2-dihydrophenyl)acetyl-CoA isomerase [Pseudomonas sp. NFACC52]
MKVYQDILVEESNGVMNLTLNRPDALNALRTQTLQDIVHALDDLRDRGSARVLVLTGMGRAFSAGADLAAGDGNGDLGYKVEHFYNPILETLMALPVPVISVVNGPAVGAGCALALAGDIVLASRSAYFLQAFINIGLVPDAGSTWLLPRLMGRARAQAMMMLGERISAQKAEAWGMIYQVVDDELLASESAALAQRLAAGPTKAYALIRQGVRYALDHSLTEALVAERRSQRIAGSTEDFAEGVAAFREKRQALFQGR